MKIRLYKKFRKRIKIIINGWMGPLPKPDKWVFIVGCYNSGTTLLHYLLSTHPEIGSMHGEGQFHTDQLLRPRAVGLNRLWSIQPELFQLNEMSNNNTNVMRLKRQWGAKFNDANRPILIEKSPTNAARTRWLQMNFENAHFIGIIRNGYAVAEGIHRKTGHSLELAARQWVKSNEILLNDFNFLRKKIIVTYERLCESPEEILRELYNFLDLSYKDVDVSSRKWIVHKELSEIKNMNYKSFQLLNESQLNLIETIAGEMLSSLGYSREKIHS